MSGNGNGYTQYPFNNLLHRVSKNKYGTQNFDSSCFQFPAAQQSFVEQSAPTMTPQFLSDDHTISYLSPALANNKLDDLGFTSDHNLTLTASGEELLFGTESIQPKEKPNGQNSEANQLTSVALEDYPHNGNETEGGAANIEGKDNSNYHFHEAGINESVDHSSENLPVVKRSRSRQTIAAKADKTITRVRRPPRQRKKVTTEKSDKPKIPKLDRPLSEITSKYDQVPIRDMESWVNRSAEQRKQEAVRRGYVTRPMNAFMLYRSAFAEKTKYWCLQNNHQVVSTISGESWPLEPEHIREKYNQLANIERLNHQAAHPGYKFSPNKPQTNKRRRGTLDDDRQTEQTELDDTNDHDNRLSERTKKKRVSRQSRQAKCQKVYSASYMDFPGMPEGGASRSSFQATNPGKTPPACMGSTDMTGSYYQTRVQASRSTPTPNGNAVIEDVTIQKTQVPGRLASLSLHHSWIVDNKSTDECPWPQRHVESIIQENPRVDPVLLVKDISNGDSFDQSPRTAEDIDEGFEVNSLDFDPLFQAETDTNINHFHYSPHAGSFSEFGQLNHTSPLDSGVDLYALPAFHESMHGFIDDPEPWSVMRDDGFGGSTELGASLKYEEWLQE